jgi:pyridoxamine 5'-phosphate oxidase
MAEIIYPIWRQRLARSLHINRSQVHSKYFQVASVCSNGYPKNRTVVFRGFLSGTQSLLSVTDLRSEKVTQWQDDHPARFEICWYFSDSREQYRLAGEAVLIANVLDSSERISILAEQTKQSLLKQQWSNLSPNAQQPFNSSSPKAPFDENSLSKNPQNGPVIQNNVNNNGVEMSENFCVIVFIPDTVDYLNLTSKPQQRCLYDKQDGWKELLVNP